jgi:hypothetical protein
VLEMGTMRSPISVLVVVLLAALPRARAVGQETAAGRLRVLMDEEWAARPVAEPLLTTGVGVCDELGSDRPPAPWRRLPT